MKSGYRTIAAALGAAALMLAQPALAASPKLPNTIAWSTYGVGSAGYNQVVAIGSALKEKYGVNLRIIPGGNDISRILPLTTGKLDFAAYGIGTFMAQEGLYEFSDRKWGPLPLRLLLTNISDQSMSIVATADSGVKTIADLKGKRVCWVIGSSAVNQGIRALLAFGNLDWKDVVKVEFGGYGAGMAGILNNQTDACFSSSVAGHAYEQDRSPRGLVYPTLPAADIEGWKRVQEQGPYFVPIRASEGAGLSKDKPVESSTYPYPILLTLPDRKDADVYAMVQAMVETYPIYKDGAPGNVGWALERQNFEWVTPYHDGAIQYFRDRGLWTEAHQKHNDAMIRRQQLLADTWQKVMAQNLEGTAHVAAWQKARADALKEAGLPVVVERW